MSGTDLTHSKGFSLNGQYPKRLLTFIIIHGSDSLTLFSLYLYYNSFANILRRDKGLGTRPIVQLKEIESGGK